MTEVKQAILLGMGIGLLCGIVVGPLLIQPQHPLTLAYDAPAAWRTAGRCENESTCFESYVNSGTESTISLPPGKRSSFRFTVTLSSLSLALLA